MIPSKTRILGKDISIYPQLATFNLKEETTIIVFYHTTLFQRFGLLPISQLEPYTLITFLLHLGLWICSMLSCWRGWKQLFFIAILCWNIWKACNPYLFENESLMIAYILFVSCRLLKECSAVIMSLKRGVAVGRNSFWTPSPPGCIKFNFDAYFNPHSNLSGFGIIAHDDMGFIFVCLGGARLPLCFNLGYRIPGSSVGPPQSPWFRGDRHCLGGW